jgi:hypothetical protein
MNNLLQRRVTSEERRVGAKNLASRAYMPVINAILPSDIAPCWLHIEVSTNDHCFYRTKGGGPVPDSNAAGAICGRPQAHAEAGVASSFIAPPIPTSHGVTRATLMIRDPNGLFAYWELTPEFREMTARHFGCNWDDLPLVLRLYVVDEVDEGPRVVREMEASRLTDNWFFSDLLPGKTYVLDVGTRNVYNVFVALLRSNAATTPRNWAGRSVKSGYVTTWQPASFTSPFHFLS